MVRNVIGGVAATMLGMLCGCGPSYSPNTYASSAVQQANKVEQGEIVGVRRVAVSADATLGTVAGAAAGGIAGSQVDAGGPITALSALGGTVLGGVVGSGVAHAQGDTTAYEYIVRQINGELVSVTQRDAVPLEIGQNVLVITGKQARVVADYTVTPPGLPPPPKPEAAKDKPAAAATPASAPPPPAASSAAAAPASPAAPPTAPEAMVPLITPAAAAAAQPGAPVSLALPVAPASPTAAPADAASPTSPSAAKP